MSRECPLCGDVDQMEVLAALIQNEKEDQDRFDWLQAKRDLEESLELDSLTLSGLKRHTERHAAVREAVADLAEADSPEEVLDV